MSFIKPESFPCWSLILKTIKEPAGLWRSKGRLIFTFPPVLHLRSLDLSTTSSPNLRTAVWATPPQCPPPSSGGLRGFFSFNWCTLRNSLLFFLPPPKQRGQRENLLDFFLCPISASGNCHGHKTDIPEPALHQLSFPSHPSSLYFISDVIMVLFWYIGK